MESAQYEQSRQNAIANCKAYAYDNQEPDPVILPQSIIFILNENKRLRSDLIISKLKVGNDIRFKNDRLPYRIMAVGNIYLVASRKLSKREDADILHGQVERSAYGSFTEAFNHLKDEPIYTIIDFWENIRGANNLIFNEYDYKSEEDCARCIADLEAEKIEISRRGRAPLDLVLNDGL